MKKTLLLFLLLPFFALAQNVDLVKWDKPESDVPTLFASNITAQKITGSNFSILNYAGYTGTEWPVGSFISASTYIQIAITADAGYQVDLATLKYAYNPYDGSNGPRKYQVRYSKDSSFPSNGTLLLDNQSPSVSSPTNVSVAFPSGTSLLPGETMYIRFYAYDRGNSWSGARWALMTSHTQINNGSYNVPTINGKVSVYAPTLKANNDTATSIQNNFTFINVLANDLQANNPISSVAIASQSANGTAVVNSDKTIKFTPATGFTGATSFTYTIGDGTNTSTATVNVTVTAPTITDLVKWEGTTSTAPTIYASTDAVSADNLTGGSGITLQALNDEGFKGTSWPTQFSIDETKYFQLTASAKTGYKVKLSKFNFTYNGDSNLYVQRYQVRYSKDNFATSNLLIDEATSSGKVTKSLDLSNITLYAGEKLTLRIYGYKLKSNTDNGSPLFLANTNTKSTGTVPTITGTVLKYDTTDLNANDDLVTTQEKRAISFNPLTNDTNTSGATITFTQPPTAEGTVTRNNNIFTFTPATTFKGTTSFTYTLTKGTQTSTATVVVYVTELSPKLIIWNGALQQPKAVVTDSNIIGNDLTITGTNWSMGIYDNYFNLSGLQNNGSTAIDYNRYVQMSVTPKANYKLTLTQFKFIYFSPAGNGNGNNNGNGNGANNEGASMIQVRYSTDPTFPDNGTVLLGPTATTKGTDTTITLNFPTGTTVSSNTNQTFYIRIYPYAVSNIYNGYFKIKNDYGGEVGPTLSGVVEPSNLITANPDTASTNSNTAINIPILSNDENYTPLASITATQPTTGGTVQVNGTTNITFTPTPGFTGTATFEYTISNGTNYSTTTVTVNVTTPPCTPTGDQVTPGANLWNGYVYKLADNAALPPSISFPALPSSSIATYIGTVTESKNFDRDNGNGAISGVTTNFACDAAPSDRFFVRYKMTATITEDGLYGFNLGSDDGIRLYIDGTQVFARWNGHGYVNDYFTYNLTAGDHQFVLEYYEDGGAARASFYFGLPKGDPTEYGDKVWNVYGYVGNNLTLANTRYAGYYVDPHLNIYSTAYWTRDKSPSSATIWQGAQVPNDNFTTVFKRKGFVCGQYQIEHVNHDDAVEIYIDDVLIFAQDGWNNNFSLVNSGQLYALNSNSRVEIRLREDGGDANLGFNFVKKDAVYNGTGTVPNGSTLVINANTTLTSDLSVCSCTVNAGYTLTVPTDVTLTVDEDIVVGTGGKLVIQSGGAFLQTSTSKTMFAGETTAFEYQRTINVARFDLTYWSIPVDNPSFTLHHLSPNTLGDKYYYWDPDAKWLTSYNGIMPMNVGQGYSVRAPQNFDYSIPSDFTAKFYGTPNNGDIPVNLASGKSNFIGNPYPSAISADDLLTNNDGLGALYFWTHNTPPAQEAGSNVYKYSTSDFATYTKMGGSQAISGGTEPDGYIAAGQGFFVKPSISTVLFTNALRLKANNKTFFKTNGSSERNRLWLNLSNNESAFKQTLLGYADGATNGWDNDYDAVTLNSNTYVDFYSINESKKLTIQGRALPFDNTEVIPLGYKTTVAGDFTIAIDHADGFFNTQAVYLEDKTTGIVTDLRVSNYTFTTTTGTFTDRFTLKYTDKTLGTGDFENSENNVLVSVKSKVIKVTASSENIKEVQIYNIGGQQLYSKNKIESNELQITNLLSSNQVLLVKVILENGHTVTKKIIFN